MSSDMREGSQDRLPQERMRVLQVIPDLGVGGAERMLLNLVCALDPRTTKVRVMSLYGRRGTAIEKGLEEASIDVLYLDKKPGLDLMTLGRVASSIRAFAPDVVHTHRGALQYALPSIALPHRWRVVHTVHSLSLIHI